MDHTESVQQYYENNTRKFLRFSKNAANKSIHQPLWKELDFTLEQAYNFSNELIVNEIKNFQAINKITVADLGCGVGSSLYYLAKRLPDHVQYYGISISTTQIQIAKQQRQSAVNSSNIHFIQADFTKLPTTLPPFDIVYSIEAFAHAAKAEKYFKQVSIKLIKGGKLILIDDFLNDTFHQEKADAATKKALADFQYGWMVNSLKKVEELQLIAATFELRLVEEEDLTPYLKINTFKHKWVRFMTRTFRWIYELSPRKSYYFRSWIGGAGKQYCLQKEVMRYKKLVFEKY